MVAWLTVKFVAIFLGLATTAFCISTIVLAVQNTDLENDLQDALNKIDALTADTTSTSTTTTTAIPGGTTPNPGGTTPSGGATTPGSGSGTTPGGQTSPGGGTTPGSGGTTPGGGTTPAPGVDPIYPTLPTGLPDPEAIQWRLPTELRPIKYKIYIHPDLQTGGCEGTVSIQFQLNAVTNLIVLHAKDLNVHSISILNMMARMRIAIEEYYLDDTRELLMIKLKEVLSMNKAYTLSASFDCNLESLTGSYRSSYTDAAGNQKWIASTKFEPTYARWAFPCFDEPALKAQFTITIARPSGDEYHVLSNMPVAAEYIDGDLTEVTFQETVPMSTYLAAFVVSDFAHKTTTSSVNPSIEVRTFAPAAQVEKTQYALDIGVGVLDYYINYFNISYPLPKLDLVAIPDFVSGAMENWGLVTFRETALLYDEATSSSVNKQRVAVVVAHELAHQWFGNLVTMNWWSDLWLNEGFASFIEYKGTKHMHADWDMDNQFVIEELHPVLIIDATLASHPIVKSIESPAEITEYFDTITYSKGAALVRMLENLVGEAKFKNGTTRYLKNNIYSTATTEDYLTAIEEEEGLEFDVKQIMQTWTEQMGLPVVEVEKNGNSYKLTQKRFLANADDYEASAEASSFNYRWSIPITYTSSINSEVQSLIFNHNDNEASITLTGDASWIKFNKDQVGYYRVNYAAEQWAALTAALKASREDFSTADRAHLLNDANTLAAAGQLNYAVALDLSTYLESEQDYVPWSVGTSSLASLRNRVYYTDLYSNFTTYARKLLTPIVEKVTFTVGTNHLENRLRIKVLSSACAVGHVASLQQAVTLFNQWLVAPETRPSPDIRDVVYYYGLQQVNTEAAWDQVWQLYLAEADAQEKVRLMNALAAVKVPWLLQRYINLAADESNVRRQDYFTLLGYVSVNPVGQSLVWDYVREHWEQLVERFGINERTLGRLIPTITSRFYTQTKVEEMQHFFEKYPEAGAGTAARQQALETVKANIKWLSLNKQQVGEWLANYAEQSTVTNSIK
ncbi:glutamyl aminopeptidase isoform X2 [Drosophila guanche]|uniref:glutamyl aminopeptidase n=1 Tax=Drosophila guanche TaxID=7266 RepID=A0A3B0KHG4_DROGU|nr:glutamyl aminopeptidase isoform X2 [Drosophila guanche]SPP87880.1 blast:Glutamyl aminopeptidase [Drosophila guanche]